MDAHLEGIAEPVRATGRSARELRAEPVQLEELAVQPPCGQEALEHVAEAAEEPGVDQTGDLAVPAGLPTAVVEPPLEQPREADLVRQVLDLGRLSLAFRRVLRQRLQVGRRAVAREAEVM